MESFYLETPKVFAIRFSHAKFLIDDVDLPKSSSLCLEKEE